MYEKIKELLVEELSINPDDITPTAELVADLGALWEAETGLPLPLGAIVIRRDIANTIRKQFEQLLRDSVAYAFDNPLLSRNFVKQHAQELEDEVIDKHISLFVNKYTLSLGAEGRMAVEQLTDLEIDWSE